MQRSVTTEPAEALFTSDATGYNNGVEMIQPKVMEQSVMLLPLTLCLFIFLTNGIFLFTLKKDKGLQMSKKIKVLLANIAVAFVIFSVSVIVNKVGNLTRVPCLIVLVVVASSGYVTISGVLLMALEVHLVSGHTNLGPSGMRPRLVYLLIGVSWIFWLAAQGAAVIDSNDSPITLPCIYANPYFKGKHVLFSLTVALGHFSCILGVHLATLHLFKKNINKVMTSFYF